MASISMMKMLIKTRKSGFAALLITGVMGAGALQAQTPSTPGAEDEVRWTLPPPPRSLTAPAPVAPARIEAQNPFGGAPVMQQAAPAPMEQPSILAPSAMPPAAMQPPVSAQAPAPLPPAAPVMAPPAPVTAAAPVAAPPPAEPKSVSAPQQAAPSSEMKQPAAKQQAEKATSPAKPAAKVKPEAKVAAKPSPKPATDPKVAKAKDGKPARVAAKPLPAPRPEYVPPPPSMVEKEPEESRIPVISTVMDGMSSVTKTIGGLFD